MLVLNTLEVLNKFYTYESFSFFFFRDFDMTLFFSHLNANNFEDIIDRVLGAELFSYLAGAQGEHLTAKFKTQPNLVGEVRHSQLCLKVPSMWSRPQSCLSQALLGCRPNTFRNQNYPQQ